MRRTYRTIIVLALLLLALPLPALAQESTPGSGTTDKTDWATYGHDPGGMRYVDVDQITPDNASKLEPAWILHTGVANGQTSFESQPIVVDGVMYVSSPHDHVFAIDAASGEVKWTYNPDDMPSLNELAICCGQTNRGVAVGDGKVFIGRLDAQLVALDETSGKVAWQVPVTDWREKWTETMAPLFVDGKVIIGASGGEFLNRGFVDAYDAKSGEQLWRFYTVPGFGEPGNETWAGDSWRTGGATVWSTPVADLDLGLLYITTGNAAPDENGSARAGDNLYATSVVALDLNTGTYRWHFQEVHHDLWDYDAVQPAHLFTLEKDGEKTPALGHANKNGNYFILDRRDGTPLYDVTEQAVPTEPSWQHPSPTQPDPATEPLIPQEVDKAPDGITAAPMWTPPQEQPHLIQPGFEAGPEWSASAYSPRTKYAYIQAGGYEPWLYHATETLQNSLGSTGVDAIPGVTNYGLFDAMDTTSGKLAWQIKTPQKVVSGVAVAGDLVFFGESNGQFNAVDAKSGDIVWTYKPDGKGIGGANGSPAVYTVDGREYVVMTFGGNNQVRSGQISPTGDAVIAFALPEENGGKPNEVFAEPSQVETGEIAADAMVAPVALPPAGATLVEIETHDFSFFPNDFSVAPGAEVAIHLTNTGVPPSGIAIKLPDGAIALKGPLVPMEDAYFVFTAPDKAGAYSFFSPLGPQRFFGMTGTMTVAKGAQAEGTPTASGTGQEKVAYEVKIENLTSGQPFSPPVAATHGEDIHLFQVGEDASDALAAVAQDGDPIPLFQRLQKMDGVTDAVNVGAPLTPAGKKAMVNGMPVTDSATFQIAAAPGDRFSLATMLICTNDGFLGLDSVELPKSGSAEFMLDSYDAGREENTEVSEDLVDPCSALGPTKLKGDPDGNVDDGTVATSPMQPIADHPGINGNGELTKDAHGWDDPVAKVTITRLEGSGEEATPSATRTTIEDVLTPEPTP